MSKNIIYCYSGSGNCLDIAKNIAAVLGDTDIVMMRSFPEVTNCIGAERVGFVFPCYAGGLPGRVEEYVRSISIGRDAYKFAVCSCSGYPGVGLAKIDEIVGLDYHAVITHKCSCIWLLPPSTMVPPMSAGAAQKRSEKLAAKVGADAKAFVKCEKKPSAPAVNRLESSLWPMLSAKKAQKMTVTDSCVACGQCAEICPQKNIRIENGRAVIGTDCIQCLSCLQYCPRKAINLGGITVKRGRYHNSNVRAADLAQKVIHIA